MPRAIIILLLIAASATAATTRLYLKDGTYQLTREYKLDGDRVRYFSTERGDWEEIPADLVDLKRTGSEAKRIEETTREEAKTQSEEDKAEREVRREIEKVPVEPGVYRVQGKDVTTMPLGESKVVGDKKRSILKALSPIPIVSGKGTLELDGEHSKSLVADTLPEFYIRLAAEERFGMIRLGAHKGNRVVEELTIIPVSKEILEKQDEVEIFRRQVGDGLYKIWPKNALAPGEYAVVEYTAATSGTINLQTWDFSLKR